MIAAPVASERSNGHLPDMRHPGLRHEAVVEMKAILLAPLPIVRRRFGCARMQRMPRAHDAELVQEPLLEHAMSSLPSDGLAVARVRPDREVRALQLLPGVGRKSGGGRETE